MRIKQISVKGLFRILDHSIPLNQEDRITIIHGPNGFGKTTLLRMVNALFNARYSELQTIPFRELWVDFDDGSNIQVSKSNKSGKTKKNENDKNIELIFDFSKNGLDKSTSFSPKYLKNPTERRSLLASIEREIPELKRIGSDTWLYIPTRELLSLNSILERFRDLIPTKYFDKTELEWDESRKSIDVRFIETQRLLSLGSIRQPREYIIQPTLFEFEVDSERQPPMEWSVTKYSKELGQAINSKLTEYATLSQALDRTFPVRLVRQNLAYTLTNDELQNKLASLEEKRSHLMEVGLLDKKQEAESLLQATDDNTRNVLSVYVEDVEQKLGVFAEMADKIDLLQRIVKERFKYKQMTISKEKGFIFTTQDNNFLSPTDLSSGEQHELVLLYELLFKVKPGSLILIDEPEISLHVGWQVQFLKDLQEITKLAKFDVIVATHSPDIINNRWDLTVELKGPDA